MLPGQAAAKEGPPSRGSILHLTLKTLEVLIIISYPETEGGQAGLAGRSALEINVFIVALDITGPD